MSNKPTLTATLAEFQKGIEKARAKAPPVAVASPAGDKPAGPKFNPMALATIYVEPDTVEGKNGEMIDILRVTLRKPGISAQEMDLKARPFSHTFRGFYHANVRQAGKTWTWKKALGCYEVPVEDTELLFRGLGENFGGSDLVVGGKIQKVPSLPRGDLLAASPAAS